MKMNGLFIRSIISNISMGILFAYIVYTLLPNITNFVFRSIIFISFLLINSYIISLQERVGISMKFKIVGVMFFLISGLITIFFLNTFNL